MKEWTVVVADSQSAGKGQRGNAWQSDEGKNLLCSVVLFPSFLKSNQQFLISACASLAILETIKIFGVIGAIKWPNDVLVNREKIAGLLIENTHRKGLVDSSIIGIGLNVNQMEFPNYKWPATSIRKALGGLEINLEDVLVVLMKELRKQQMVMKSNPASLIQAFNESLELKGEQIAFQTSSHLDEGILLGVEDSGELILLVNGLEKRFVNGEIKLMRI